MSKQTKNEPIQIYLDTCVLLDFMIKERKNDISKYLLRQLDGNRLVGIITGFSLLELRDQYYSYSDLIKKFQSGTTPSEIIRQKKERILNKSDRTKDNEEIEDFLNRNKRNIRLALFGDTMIWERALELLGIENFSAPDAVQLSGATLNKCPILISKDEEFIKLINKTSKSTNVKGIHYNNNTKIERFTKHLNSITEAIKKPEMKPEELEAKESFESLISLIQPEGFDAKAYEEKIRRMIKKKD